MDIGKPSTWVKFEKQMCDSCWGTCCHDWPIEVSVPDMIRLELITEVEASTSLRKAARRLAKDGITEDFRPDELVFVLAHKENRDCVFLDDERRCTVYTKRPQICREFPKIGPRPGHCPYRPK